MEQSASMDESLTTSGSVSVGNNNANAKIGGSAGIELAAEAHLQADATGIDAGASYTEIMQASAIASGSVEKEGFGVAAETTVYIKTGTEFEGHVVAGDHGIDMGAGASIGNAAGVDAQITESVRYVETTAGAGVSIGEHFEAGGAAQATCEHGVVAVGVSGDVAALVGVDIDIAVSVDTKQIVSDGKEVVHVAETVAPIVQKTADKAVHTVEHAATSTANTVGKGINSAAKSVKKAFKKIKI
jgi:hypothetical protein